MRIKLIFFFSFLVFPFFVSAQKGHEIKVRVEGIKDTLAYLGYHYGDKQYVTDTTRVDSKGNFSFKGDEPLEGGIYLVVLPNKSYFEILVSEQRFSIETDTIDLVNHLKVTGSKENLIFNGYQRFLVQKQKEIAPLKAWYDAWKSNPDSAKAIQQLMKRIDQDVKDFRLKILRDHPKSFTAALIRCMIEPEAPEPPKDEKGNIDSTFQFYYIKNHLLDSVDFSDARLLRSPLLQQKIKAYTETMTIQVPDSIIPVVDTIIERSKKNQEVFKYALVTLTNHYETSKIMGHDEVFVHLAEKYYVKEDAFWVDSTLRAKLWERIRKIKPNILGKTAHDLVMKDTSGKVVSLHGVKAKYTILVFWSPTCSHCKEEIPKLFQTYDSLKAEGVEAFAIGIESDPVLWRQFIREHNLNWINVTDLYEQTRFRDYYDISTTPVIYLLDEKKKIVAKRLDVPNLSMILRKFLKKEIKETK
ncbi:MAG TPA: redoxin domain-containing protein [Bacteroidia bacterium]|nr:redoxin domain-containing protein [Bacteroidia bacterium]